MTHTMAAFALVMWLGMTEAQSVRVEDPFDVWMPPVVAATWNNLALRSSRELVGSRGEISIELPASLTQSTGRLDVLILDGGLWRWQSSYAFVRRASIGRSRQARGILVRLPADPIYYWGEVPAADDGLKKVVLRPMKNILVTVPDPRRSPLALFTASEMRPRLSSAGNTFRKLPAEAAIVCASLGDVARCSSIGASELSVVINERLPDARIVQSANGVKRDCKLVGPGSSAILPRTWGGSEFVAGPWMTVTRKSNAPAWANLVMDCFSSDAAMERVNGSSLVLPPDFEVLKQRADHGVVMRARVGDRVLSDNSAVLMVFPTSVPQSGQVAEPPLGVASVNADGEFVFSHLGSDRYVVELLSASASDERRTVSATAGVPVDIEFAVGPKVSGRVVLALGGTPADPVTLNVAPYVRGEALSAAGDAFSKFRVASADEAGRFSVVLAHPGRYRLLVRWGSATAERIFEIGSEDVALGDISLAAGASLYGSVPPCSGGKIVAFVVPGLDQAPDFDEVTANVDVDGRFVLKGLKPGPWSVSLRCEGRMTRITPAVVNVPKSGDLAVDFKQLNEK